MKKNYGIFGLLIITMMVIFTGCAQWDQKIKADGGLIGTYTGAWVVEKMSGGVITDVYLLDDAICKSEQGSDGWLFLDQNGNPIHIGGDMKAIRCNNEKVDCNNQSTG